MQQMEAVKKSPTTNSRQSASVLDGLYRVVLHPHLQPDSLIQALFGKEALYIEPVYEEQLLFTPDDRYISTNQPYLAPIKAFEAWDISRSSSDVTIAIVDTGVDLEHEDIRNKLRINHADPPNGIDDDENGYVDDYRGYDFADRDSIAQCAGCHGNRVAGIAAAETNNAKGIAGVGYHAMISPLKIFRSTGNTANNAYDAIVYAADMGFDIINLSWGSVGTYSQAAQDIITYAVKEKGAVVIGAAGNTPSEIEFYPASYEGVLSVAATDNLDNKAGFSTYNHYVDLSAPGASIFSTNGNNSYTSDNGTSYSAPMVAGAAALVRTHLPALNASQIMELLRVSADDIYGVGNNSGFDGKLGKGRLNIHKSLAGADTMKALRLEQVKFVSPLSTQVFYGDTAMITASLTNFLNPLQNVQLTFSSASEHARFIQPSLAQGAFATLESRPFAAPVLTIDPSTPPGTPIWIRVGYSDNGYRDFQYVKLVTAPNYVHFGNPNIRMTVAGNGEMGYTNADFANSIGLTWKGTQLLTQMGFGFGSEKGFSDNFPTFVNGTNRASDFQTVQPIKLQHEEAGGVVSIARFSDAQAQVPQGILVQQKTYANATDDFLILEYLLINTTKDTLRNLAAGLYTNWNLPPFSQNRARYDANTGSVLAWNADETIWAASKLYGFEQRGYQALDVNALSGNRVDVAQFTDELVKLDLVRQNQFDSAGFVGTGNDIVTMVNRREITFFPGQSQRITFLLAAGASAAEIASTLRQAELFYESILQLPELESRITSCKNGDLTLNPASGKQFRFYVDPYGQSLIREDSVLALSNLQSDTTYYLKNMDKGYEDAMQRIEIRLTPAVADFQMSTDTLYLDHPSTNLLQLQDASFEPLRWSWDFGNGSRSTLRNPTTSYQEPGVYTVSLTTESAAGCTGTTTKTLWVVHRPAPLVLGHTAQCEGEDWVISETDTLAFYLPSTTSPIAILPPPVRISSLGADTCLTMSRVVGGLYSLKTSTCASVSLYRSSFTYTPDTTSTATGMVLRSAIATPEIQWLVNGTPAGTERELRLEVTQTEYAIELVTRNELGCSSTFTQTLQLTPGPTPEITFEQPCAGNDLTLMPGNGQVFAYYADAARTQLLKKGKWLTLPDVQNTQTVYVVNLDGILPSPATEVQVMPVSYQVAIRLQPDTLYLSEGGLVRFIAEAEGLANARWTLNGASEMGTEIQLFFDTPGSYPVELEAHNIQGCEGSDTAVLVVLAAREEVLLPSQPRSPDIQITPNPSQGKLLIRHVPPSAQIQVTTLSGKVLIHCLADDKKEQLLDLSAYPNGIYLLQVTTPNARFTQKIIKH